ncbi:protein STRUBBELIG-RECEPTOR FAMILY 2 isoform X2 [Telopea speciosissima]|uniref:protein STRUBBELIG-RECEPTOR FAMILY 2 isoform X2 n=1 Tax=Telopea speciosissima TaxID=54955 RepID=UPI001CC5B691|nr:protein STRUBBELIG-RECEPTOR FAMILY 2 isoform X2 [Telopea speciosissima]
MARLNLWFTLSAYLLSTLLLSPISAKTDPVDAAALKDLYRALNYPAQLKGWKRDGGDPCEESWIGISCSGSSVIFIHLHGLRLGGNLGDQLSNLLSLQELDVSGNNIQGEIPSSIPPNATYFNLACNNFSQSIPYSLNSMKRLRHLNLSHNSLSGPIGNVFTDLQSVRQMDLSYNNFTGDLPSSFGDLTNLTKLFLQNNNFSGSVIFLANLPLSDLNIQNNHFSGVIPKEFQLIPNLWIAENMFHNGANYPPWIFPWDNLSTDQNINGPPTTQSTATENYPHVRGDRHKHKRFGLGGIACMVGGGTLLATCAALIVAVHINRSRSCKLENLKRDDSSLHTLPLSTTAVHRASDAPEVNSQNSGSGSPPMINSWRILSVHHNRTEGVGRISFSGNTRNLPIAKRYTMAEIQSATNSFHEENILGEGSLGSVYKAKFPDGQILAVKSIKTVPLSLHEEEQFLDVIWKAARLRHPNIIRLLGYCVEHGQHLLVYEYVRNLSLDNVLHSDTYMPLSWSLRVRISLGIAQALDYLHTSCFPPCPHCNLKAANILLDDDLMPHLCDCGLAILRPLTCNTVKLKASEMAISCTVYVAPEHGQPRVDNRKSDIYAFGVLLLELLTGRKPFNRSNEEQCLVKWASLHLHDNNSLEEMVDPTIKRAFSSRDLSRLADIISLCIRPDPEFRPPMSEIVDSLVSLDQSMSTGEISLADGNEVEASERSFRSTDTRFRSSPLTSHVEASERSFLSTDTRFGSSPFISHAFI